MSPKRTITDMTGMARVARTFGVALAAALLVALAGQGAGAVTAGQSGGPAVVRVAERVAIVAPDTVDPGALVEVAVPGASGGALELWGPIGTDAAPMKLSEAALEGERARIQAPSAAGSYELRYVDERGRVRARFVIDVAAIPVVLRITNLPLGVRLDARVEWLGPAAPGDKIQFYDPATGRVASEAPAVGTPGAFNVTVLPTPDRPGLYELRYYSGAKRAALRSLEVAVEDKGLAWLETPIEVNVGERFTVVWHGTTNPDQAVELVDPATGTALASVRPDAEGRAQLRAPARPGRYLIRYVDTAIGFVYTELPLDVDPR